MTEGGEWHTALLILEAESHDQNGSLELYPNHPCLTLPEANLRAVWEKTLSLCSLLELMSPMCAHSNSIEDGASAN